MRGFMSGTDIIRLMGCLPLFFALSSGAVTISFDGELIDRPCQIASDSLNQTVQFLSRPVKDFYIYPGKSPAEKFSIHLVDCDTHTMWKTVKLKFYGTNEPEMNELSEYFLRVSGKNEGKLAIGLLDTDGVTPLKLGMVHNNKQGSYIEGKTVTMNFKAFVQATPAAVINKSIQPGEYSSVVNFELFYE